MNSQMIGGMFGLVDLSKSEDQFPPFLEGRELFLYNARSGINIVASLLKPQVIWMPSFLCDAMLKAVHFFNVQFYDVDSYLQVPGKWLDYVQRDDLVVFIDYFGFPFDPDLATYVKQRGGWVLEDACQALHSSHVGKFSDFVLFSPRKFLSVPDGGILRYNVMVDFSANSLKDPPSIDNNSPVGPYTMSTLSKILLERSFDYSSICKKRIENYRVLNNYLSQFALFPNVPEDVVPLGYPIRLENRDYVRKMLFNNNIYPPVHWPIKNIVPEKFVESHRLADTILTLVCDQRYNPTDMKRTAEIVLQYAK
jgi:hypothetical protein